MWKSKVTAGGRMLSHIYALGKGKKKKENQQKKGLLMQTFILC